MYCEYAIITASANIVWVTVECLQQSLLFFCNVGVMRADAYRAGFLLISGRSCVRVTAVDTK